MLPRQEPRLLISIMPTPRGLDPSLMQVNSAALHLIGCCQMKQQEKESTQESLLSQCWDSERTEMESSETWVQTAGY